MSEYVQHERFLTLAAVVVVPLLVVLALMWREQHERIDDIQQSRAEVAYDTCLDQNTRHVQTVKRLDNLLEKATKKEPDRAADIAASRESTLFLLDAILPEQDCAAIVRERFGFMPEMIVER